jgi:hypothetical protein
VEEESPLVQPAPLEVAVHTVRHRRTQLPLRIHHHHHCHPHHHYRHHHHHHRAGDSPPKASMGGGHPPTTASRASMCVWAHPGQLTSGSHRGLTHTGPRTPP